MCRSRVFLWLPLLAFGLSTAASCKSRTGYGPRPKLSTEQEKAIYALGVNEGRRLQRHIRDFELTPDEMAVFMAGLVDGRDGRPPALEPSAYIGNINQLRNLRGDARALAEKAKAKSVLEQAERESGAEKLPSGLVKKVLRPGDGPSPGADDFVTFHFIGRLGGGAEFDNTYSKWQPATYPLAKSIRCWREGFLSMKVGEKARLTCPPELGYGDRGAPPKIPGGAATVFEIELLSVKKGEKPLPAVEAAAKEVEEGRTGPTPKATSPQPSK